MLDWSIPQNFSLDVQHDGHINRHDWVQAETESVSMTTSNIEVLGDNMNRYSLMSNSSDESNCEASCLQWLMVQKPYTLSAVT